MKLPKEVQKLRDELALEYETKLRTSYGEGTFSLSNMSYAYEHGFDAGYSEGVKRERERTKILIHHLEKSCRCQVDNNWGHLRTCHGCMALDKYLEEENEIP